MKYNDIISSLANPDRRKIFKHLAEKGEPMSPDGLSNDLGKDLNSLCYHVRVLRNAGALVLIKKRQVRGTVQHFYVADPELTAASWVQEVLDLPPVDSAER